MSLVSGINSIDSLIYTSWNLDAHTPVSLTYSFLSFLPADAPEEDRKGFTPMNAVQQDAARAALATWAAVASITFSEVASGGNIQFGTNDQSADKSAGYAYYPDPNLRYSTPLFINKLAGSSSHLAPGEYGFTVLMHEIGHTLGLKHSGDYDVTGTDTDGPFLPEEDDTRDLTLMSYNGPLSFPDLRLEPAGPMLYDIQAIQYLYGANTSYRAGDDIYRFTDSSAVQCIWDGGGVNTFDFSGCSEFAIIDLRPGEYSAVYLDVPSIWIAYGVTIQKAIGSAGADLIFTSESGSIIEAGAGHDLIFSNLGDDRLAGGDGRDEVLFVKERGAYTISAVDGGWMVVGEGRDLLTGIERLSFADSDVALDLNGVGGQTYRLYQAALGRAPDLAGLGYWIDAGDHGASLASVARQFIGSAEFARTYGVLDNAAFVTQLYQNVLHRKPDQGGLAFHLDLLERGGPREDTLISFSESPEYQAAQIAVIGNGFAYTPLG